MVSVWSRVITLPGYWLLIGRADSLCYCKNVSPLVCLAATRAGQTGTLTGGFELQKNNSFAKK